MNISPQYKLKISILDQWITSQECIKFTMTLVLVECFPLTQAQRAPHLSRHKQLGCSDSSRCFLSTAALKGWTKTLTKHADLQCCSKIFRQLKLTTFSKNINFKNRFIFFAAYIFNEIFAVLIVRFNIYMVTYYKRLCIVK